VVDNGSTDGTAAAIAGDDPDFEVVAAGKNLGASARTLGVARASAGCVSFCEDDTWWEPESLRHAADLFDAQPRLAVITGGDRLPPGTLCLTYDDRPGRTVNHEDCGPQTAELGAFLHGQGVAATFFVVGEFPVLYPEILESLRAMGHLVANHTFDHPSLPGFVAEGGDAVAQLARTDQVIRPYVRPGVSLFRAPYGDWRLKGQSRSNVAAVLNRSQLAKRYVGPIGWDIDGSDVGFWRDGRPVHECTRAYLDAIERIGRRIVLMHDSTADIEELRPRSRAVALTRELVPELRRRGYTFVSLHEVPQVAAAARVSFQQQ
jgi:peptidoglycan/xylan/chitin deacetylase (PgdA/CDA1 family)